MSNEVDQIKGEHIISKVLAGIGEDIAREGLLDTPKRVVKSWNQIYAGYKQNPEEILGTTFESAGYDQMVVLRDIELYSMCEHHMLPFHGKVHIAYIPNERVVGLSKLARLADCFAKRLQIQEKLTKQIATSIQDVLKPKGVMVVVEAQHMCMTMRGVGKQNSVMTTSAVLGAFEDTTTRNEFLSLVKGK